MDQDRGTIIFTQSDGKNLTVTCSAQTIGTYNTEDGTWPREWNHPWIEPALREHALKVKSYDGKHGIEFLTTQKSIVPQKYLAIYRASMQTD